jgi:hypothetical protein
MRKTSYLVALTFGVLTLILVRFCGSSSLFVLTFVSEHPLCTETRLVRKSQDQSYSSLTFFRQGYSLNRTQTFFAQPSPPRTDYTSAAISPSQASPTPRLVENFYTESMSVASSPFKLRTAARRRTAPSARHGRVLAISTKSLLDLPPFRLSLYSSASALTRAEDAFGGQLLS